MKRKIGLCICLLLGNISVRAEETTKIPVEKEIWVEVTNSWNQIKNDEPVVIDLQSLQLPFQVRSAVVWSEGTEIPSQLDDRSGNRLPDELVFVTDLPAGAQKTFRITLSALRSDTTYPPRTHAQMYAYDKTGAHDYLTSVTTPGNSNIYSALYHHGPAFESELVAYRIYFNEWQTVDTYGKPQRRLELEDTRFYPTDEQLAAGYGDDVLRVGQTVSVGTLKGWDAQTASVTPFDPVDFRTETVVASGPVRSIVEVINENWQYQGTELTVKTQYILYAGHRDVQVNVSFDQPLGEQIFCTGVLRKEGDQPFYDEKGLVAVWSTDWPQGDTIKYEPDTVGLAVCLPQDLMVKKVQNPQNYLYLIQAPNSRSFTYYFSFTSRRESVGFADADDWFEAVRNWKENLQHPCQVIVK